VLPDGSFLAARTNIQRFLADGTPDAGFAPWTATGVELIRALPSGDFLVGGGTLRTFNGTAVKTLIRVSAAGVVDPTFQYAGTFDTVYDAVGAHRPLAVLADGRLVIGQPLGGIRRFLADGSVDPSWTDPAPTVVVKDLVADRRGNVYVMGNLDSPAISQSLYRLAGDTSEPVPLLPSFTAQPAPLTAVAAGGTVVLEAAVTGEPAPTLQWYRDDVPLPGATTARLELADFQAAQTGAYRLVASNRVGTASSAIATVHLDPGERRPGTIDVSFEVPPLGPAAGEEGFLASTTNPMFWGGAPTADDGLYLWGNFAFRRADGAVETGVVRLDRNGRTVPGFRPADRVRDAGGGARQADGRLVLGAVYLVGTELRNGVVRLREDGSFDPAFAEAGLFDGTTQAAARLVVLQNDGGILVGGAFARVQNVPRAALIRLNPDGSLDTGFASLPVSSRVSALALAPNGDIYVGGSFSLPGATVESGVLRLHADGTRDAGFAPFPGDVGAADLEVLADGGVLVLGSAAPTFGGKPLSNPFRLDAAGLPSAGFDPGPGHRNGEALLARPDGAWLVSSDTGASPAPGRIARHLAGGALDPFYTNAPPIAFVRTLLPAERGAGVGGRGRASRSRGDCKGDDYVPPQPPAIVRPPASIDASGLQVASFRVVADGVRPLTYQWRFEGEPIRGGRPATCGTSRPSRPRRSAPTTSS
jgi:uncharacterized delta-60 repeat protein